MNIISGEKWQDICQVGISKKDHRTFESSNKDNLWLDIDEFDFENYDNPSLVYANSSLLNRFKPKLLESEFISKLKNSKILSI